MDTTHKLLACIHGVYKPASYVQHCSPKFTAGYLPNMPTSPVALRGYLQEGHDVADVRSAGHELDHSHGLA